MREPKVGDLVRFDIGWADTDTALSGLDVINAQGRCIGHMQYGIVTMIRKRTRRAWDQYIIEWNGEDLLFFGNLDKIEIVGD